ncbi:hypothetical protein ACF06X_26580 [Streptomyces sp. NPDC015346]|uniref:hypothetical protein n=1 Tax=Streptomyces sp. NPDC015346 TaxID=3364954 RepID=UPI0036FE361A
MLSGTRGQQIAGRFSLIPIAPFSSNMEWKGLVATLESTLLLHRHQPGTLTAIRGAAIDAILTGTEAVTKKSLAAVPLDRSAQSFSRTAAGARR